MRGYWVHYSGEGMLGPPRFVVFEVNVAGQHSLVSPPGGYASDAEVVDLLVARGAESEAARRTVARAAREHVARLVVFGTE